VLTALLHYLWRRLSGTARWYLLWLLHHKVIVGVSGVIRDDHGSVLLLRHRFWPEGSWGLPGGYARGGERLEDTLKREVREETGLEIQPDGLLCVTSGFKLRIEVTYTAHVIGGRLILDEREVLEARFFAVTALPESVLRTHRVLMEMVE
jgi:8-oxo-dGTP diphosphatase